MGLLGLLSLLAVLLVHGVKGYTNPRPIIGILAQETDDSIPVYGDTYIPVGYVKYIQMAGAMVVPIRAKMSEEYYTHIFKSINGMLLPGGGVSITTSEYARAANIIYDMAIQANDNGDYFPIWGTCLGFQLLTAIRANKNPLGNFSRWDQELPLDFSKDYADSRLFSNIPHDVYKDLSSLNVTTNFHNFGLGMETYLANNDLKSFFHVLSTNLDDKGKEYISTVEAYSYPIYGTQWHPEKPAYTWNLKFHINHGPEAVRVGQYMANFFVAEARRSNHKFATPIEERNALIDNYNPVFHKDTTLNVIYYFNFTANPGVYYH